MKPLLLSLLLLFLGGCSKHFTENELVGKYVLNVDDGRDTLQLNDDGTYIHSYRSKDGNVTTKNSKWELKSLDSNLSVVLENFQPLPGEKTRGAGFYFLLVQSHFGKIRLNTDVDLNEGYDKEP